MSGPRSIACPGCGGSVAIKAVGLTVSVACQYCGSLLDVANADVKLITQYHEAAGALTLPLGSRGVLDAVEWEVIGWQAREDGEAQWQEYLLFNPYAGYRWLTEAEGEWTLGVMIAERPEPDASERVSWRGKRYACEYAPVATTTTRVLGEFYWRVQAGDVVYATVFARGREQLSLEYSADEVNWTHLVPVAASDVLAAFAPKPAAGGGFGRRRLIGAAGAAGVEAFAEPAGEPERERGGFFARSGAWPLYGDSDLLWMFMLAALTTTLALVILAALHGVTGTARAQAAVPIDGAEQRFTLGHIAVTRPWQVVSVTAQSDDFVNKWVELEYSLVDSKTQQAVDASGAIEYYEGRDSDGRWTEGRHTTTTRFSSVPRGEYEVVLNASAHSWNGAGAVQPESSGTGAWGGADAGMVSLGFLIEAGGVPMSNLWLVLILVLLPPIVILWSRWNRGELF